FVCCSSSLSCLFQSFSFILFFLFLIYGPSPTTISTLSLHDALPIYSDILDIAHFSRLFDNKSECYKLFWFQAIAEKIKEGCHTIDRKSTRLNSSHVSISYAVFCLIKKNKNHIKNTKLLCHIKRALYR